MKDDKDFIDLDSTQNWSELDVKREMDNLEVNKETGERYDFARGFSDDKPKDEEAILLDGLTSGLNYIPEEFLAAADIKHEEDRKKEIKDEKPDVSWAYRKGPESSADEPFVSVADIKKAEEAKAASEIKAEPVKVTPEVKAEPVKAEPVKVESEVKAEPVKVESEVKAEPVRVEPEVKAEPAKVEPEVKAEPVKAEVEIKAEPAKAEVETKVETSVEENEASDVEAIRQKNLEAQAKKHAEINASDAAIAANIAARKKAREEAAAAREAAIKASVEAKKEAMKKAEEALFNSPMNNEDIFATGSVELIEDYKPSTKEERIAAAMKNGNSGFEENEYPDVEPAVKAKEVAKEAAKETAKEAEVKAEAAVNAASIVAAGEEALAVAEAGNVAVAATEVGEEAREAVAKKKKKKTTAAEDYAAWAEGDVQNFEGLEKKKRRKKKSEEIPEEELEDEEDDGYYYGFFGNIVHFFKKMTVLDILVACTGVLVVVVAAITLMVYSSSRATQSKIDEFVPLGENMQTIGLMGHGVFVEIADARNKVPEIEEPTPTPEEESKEYDEKEDETNISVTMSLTSVKKDLKIKFINAKTKKLVANHEFKVDIEDAKGKKYSAKDEDMDGVIYLNSVAPGKAKVTMAELPKDKGITFSREPVTINIKENLDFKKIDVSDEVKSEAQINAKAEDTAAGLATEGTLKDTVEWVESTSTQIDGGYVKVDKASVMNPAKVTPTVKVSELGVTRGVLAQRFMTSKRILVASEEVEKTEEPAPSGEVDPSNTETDDSDNDPAPSNTPAASETAPDEPIVSPVETPAVSPTEAPEEAPEEKPEAIASPTPSPKVDPKEDTTTPLTDTKGNKLYLKTKDGEFIEAKAADYYKEGLVYYRKAAEGENAKYTGWQTLKGETYFFDKNGNFVTGEQIIQGAKYTFDSKGALVKGSGVMGIDVSKWNGNINWTAVKNSGVSFVIIRCGYRGSSTGALVEDPKFRTNIKGATDAGLKVGIYFFSQAITDVEAVEEASMTIDLIKSYKISYPVFLDVEDSNGRGDRIDAGTRTAVIQAFCQTMKNSGYTAGVYANKSWLTSKMNVGSLGNFKIWLAQYNTEVTYTGRYDLWQYSSKGSVGGISGNTDMNLSYLGY